MTNELSVKSLNQKRMIFLQIRLLLSSMKRNQVVSPTSKVLLSPLGTKENIYQRYSILEKSPLSKQGNCGFVSGALFKNKERIVVKEEQISSPKNILTRTYREYQIHVYLNSLYKYNQHFPNPEWTPFIKLKEWFKTRNESGNQVSHMLMERADETLGDKQQLSFIELKCIIFQIIFGLHIAYHYFKFVHNDLHARNILLISKNIKTDGIFKFGNNTWRIPKIWIVKLCDFGNSRIYIPHKNKIIEGRNSKINFCSDLENLKQLLKKIKVTEWLTEEEQLNNDTNVISELVQKRKKQLSNFKRILDVTTYEELINHKLFDNFKINNHEYNNIHKNTNSLNENKENIGNIQGKRTHDMISSKSDLTPPPKTKKVFNKHPMVLRERKKRSFN